MRIRVALALLAFGGCRGIVHPTPTVDPGVDFAAHVEHDRMVMDRLPGGGTGVVERPGWLRLGGGPTFVLEQDGKRTAELWLRAPATVDVRTTAAAAPRVARVEPGWDDNAIRLALHTADGATLRTDVFRRTEPGLGLDVLSRAVQTVLEARGTYRASIRDARGAEVGWLRAKVSPYQDAPRIYDGVVPRDIDTGLVAGIAEALNSEIDWIEDHTLDVYRGTEGGSLRQSVPLH